MLSCRGGESCLGQFILPPIHLGIKVKSFAKFFHFRLSECNDVSIIYHNSSQIQLFSLSDCSVCLVAGMGVSCPGQFILPPTHLGIKVKLLC